MKKESLTHVAILAGLTIAGILLSMILFYAISISSLPIISIVTLKVALVLVMGGTIVEFVTRLILVYYEDRPHPNEIITVSRLLRITGYVLVLIFIMIILKIDVTSIFVGAGFIGIVIGLAAQNTLGNLFSGISMLSSRPFEEGDAITVLTWQYGLLPPTYSHEKLVPGYNGVIESVGLIYTKLIGEDGVPLFVPNNILIQALIINHHRAKEKKIRLSFEINKKINFVNFMKRLHRALKDVDGLKINPSEYLRITTVSKNEYHLTLEGQIVGVNEELIKSEILRIILDITGGKSVVYQKKAGSDQTDYNAQNH